MVIKNISSDAAPPLRDCSEVYRAGVRAPGWYQLDTSGSMNNTGDRDVYCEDGWTQILKRDADQTYDRTVHETAWLHCAYSEALLRFSCSISNGGAVTITREGAGFMKTTLLGWNASTSKRTNSIRATVLSCASSVSCRITTSGNIELKVDMWDWDNNYAVARYDSIEVTSEQNGFKLLVSIQGVLKNCHQSSRVMDPLVPIRSFTQPHLICLL